MWRIVLHKHCGIVRAAVRRTSCRIRRKPSALSSEKGRRKTAFAITFATSHCRQQSLVFAVESKLLRDEARDSRRRIVAFDCRTANQQRHCRAGNSAVVRQCIRFRILIGSNTIFSNSFTATHGLSTQPENLKPTPVFVSFRAASFFRWRLNDSCHK